MIRPLPSLTFIGIILLMHCMVSASPATIDSLMHQLGSAKTDSIRIELLGRIAKQHLQDGHSDSSFYYSNKAIGLMEGSMERPHVPEVYIDRGAVYFEQGNYLAAMKDYRSALAASEALGDKKSMANCYNLIANAFHAQGDYTNALKGQFDALKIREEIGDEQGIAWSYNNIGTIYRIQGDYKAALENYRFALHILVRFNDRKSIALCYNSIGTVYTLEGKYTDALQNYYSSLYVRHEINAQKDIIASYLNIGDAYCDLFEKDSLTKFAHVETAGLDTISIPRKLWLDTAMNLVTRAQAMNKDLGNTYYNIFIYSGMGRINYLSKHYRESIRYYSRAYAIAEELNALDLQKEIAGYLANDYDSLRDALNGRKWYMKFVAHKDSLQSQLKSDELIQTRMKYEFEKKESEARAEQEQKDAQARHELDRQKRVRTFFQAGFALVLLFAGVFFYQRNNIRKEKGRSDDLLLNILPSEVASELKQRGSSQSKSFDAVTVMFTDFVDFTKVSEKVRPEELVQEIHACFSAFDNIIQKHKVEKIKTIGDAYLCAGGLPVPDPNHALNVVNAAAEIMSFMDDRKKRKDAENQIAFQLRIGIHSGPVVAGIVGVKKYAYDIWGDTVNIAARMEQNSQPGKINLSSATYELVKDRFKCTYRGKIEAKNKGEIDMYFLEA